MKAALLGNTALKPPPKVTRRVYRCTIVNSEIADLGPNPTWDDWRALLLSKEIPPARLVDGADFKMTETKDGAEIEFP